MYRISSRPIRHAAMLAAVLLAGAPAAAVGETPASAESDNRIEAEGIAVRFDAEPLAREDAGDIVVGQDALVSFAISDAASGKPISGLFPAAWMDIRRSSGGNFSCKEKIKSFLQGTLAFRPDLDLTTWYILAMNEKASISVIDPLVGYGGQRLIAMIRLQSAAADWALSEDAETLYVSMPESNQVALVDTANWKIAANIGAANIETGAMPVRVALQGDEKYLWVGTEGGKDAGVTVIDTENRSVAAHIPTGAGHHEIAFGTDDRYAFVSNDAAGTVSVIDVRELKKIKDINTGSHPMAVAYSGLSQALYVVDPEDGTITVIDGRSHEVVGRMKTKTGVRAIEFTNDDRWAFAANPKADEVYVADATRNRIVHTVAVAGGPDQVAVTDTFAYIRPAGADSVTMVALDALGSDEKLPVTQITSGQTAPRTSRYASPAAVITPTPEENSVLIANPADKMIYYYREGMGAPMGSYRNEGRTPRAVLVVDKSLEEDQPGVYATTVRPKAAGDYDVAFLLDTPRVMNCFTMTVAPDPTAEHDTEGKLEVEFLTDKRVVTVAEEAKLKFRLLDSVSRKARDGVGDLRIMAQSTRGNWRKLIPAKAIGEGIYEAALSAPRAGPYYIYFESPSQGLRLHDLPFMVLHAKTRATNVDGDPAPAQDEENKL
jgi:YVTN family beta-propeller protein